MSIKKEAIKYFKGEIEEQEMAHKLDEAFEITFRDVFGNFSYWFGEPKSTVTERFGLQQEILIIYSKHTKTDARVLTAIENIVRKPDFKYRLDKVLFILIHNGNEEETLNLIKASEDRIIVPIHFNQLNDNSRGSVFIRTNIANAIGSVDLFGMTSAITSDKYFFGRNALVQSLISRTTIQKENSGLFGLRKTGKTSVLRAIQRRLDGKPVLVEYFECSNPGVHTGRWWQVLQNIVERFISTLSRDFGINIELDTNYSDFNGGSKFISHIKDIIKTGQLNQIVMMLDEIEFITHGLSGALGKHWDNDFLPFWQTIRSTNQETKGQIVFIVAGVNPSCVEKSHIGTTQNPIFQLALPHYLEPFQKDLVREMVRSIGKYSGLKFSEDAHAFLQNTYGGHPFLIRIACSVIWKSVNKTNPETLIPITVQTFMSKQIDIKHRLNNPIKDILLSLVWWYPEEYDLLRILATGDAEFVQEYIISDPKSVFQFAQYGILKKENHSEFAISDIRDFLNTHGETYLKEISPFTRGDLPMDLLPEIPDLFSIGQLFEKRSEVEINLRRIIILYLSVKNAFDNIKISKDIISVLPRKSDRPDVKDLFVGRTPQEVANQLYVPDLKSIIAGHWDIFKNIFDTNQSRFEMNMDTLNKARRNDAHTKPLSKAEFEDFDNSYTWILNKIAKIK
jgi:hypothetical protein